MAVTILSNLARNLLREPAPIQAVFTLSPALGPSKRTGVLAQVRARALVEVLLQPAPLLKSGGAFH